MVISDLKHLEVVNENTGILGGACPYTTKDVTTRLRIRSGPGTSYKIVGYWYPGEVKYLTGVTSNNFRLLAHSNDGQRWVSKKYVKRTGGECVNAGEV